VTAVLLRPSAVLARNVVAYRRMWLIFLTGFVEPLLYLGSIGIGVGELVGDIAVPGVGPVPYREFVAPALVATSAMNGAIFDATFGFFFKLKYATPSRRCWRRRCARRTWPSASWRGACCGGRPTRAPSCS
jgi:hypothetical protein